MQIGKKLGPIEGSEFFSHKVNAATCLSTPGFLQVFTTASSSTRNGADSLKIMNTLRTQGKKGNEEWNCNSSLGNGTDEGQMIEYESSQVESAESPSLEPKVTFDTSRIARKGFIEAHDASDIKVRVKYGGYVMAGFSSVNRKFSPSDVEYMRICVKALESLFTCE